MSNLKIRKLYSQKAKFYQSFFIHFLKWEKVLGEFFHANHYLHSRMKILDAGCGTGPVTKVLFELANQQGIQEITFHAFDITPEMLELFGQWIENEGAKNIWLRQADALDLERQLPEDWKGYDLIVSSAMLEYIPEEKLGQALVNLRHLLHENGRLLVFVTRKTCAAALAGKLWWKTNLFDPKALEAEFRQAGFPTVRFKQLPEKWNAFMIAVEASVSRK